MAQRLAAFGRTDEWHPAKHYSGIREPLGILLLFGCAPSEGGTDFKWDFLFSIFHKKS